MKKTIAIIIGFLAIMCFTGSVYAAAITWSVDAPGGGTVIIGTGTTLTFGASPGVMINGGNDVNTYCILAGNVKAGADAIVFNVASGSGRVAQKAVDLSTATAASALGTPSTTGLLLTDFTTK